ncbi:putative helix-turn-helix-containing protein [Escherichia coli M605]|uniref:Putative helix-turn-helix-containing protein n=1 Tax=Escherichia coli M605 TaxID=656417 RepID=F4SUQ1_ECOLX|nr:helix-turn-helix transcriptional regulator [Escherichia coli]EGI17663.1 putative helix-turn-helix-containing protein [Escherichia coli M605]
MLKDVLRLNREKLKLKQSDIADYVGVTTQTYMKWENGKNEPKASHIKKLSEILNVTANEICQGQIYDTHYEAIDFMKKVASLQKFIDEVSFTSLLYNHIKEKKLFIAELEKEMKSKHGFSIKDLEDHKVSEDKEIAAYNETEIRSECKWENLP